MSAHVELAAVLTVMVVGGTLGGRWVLWEFRHRRHQEHLAAARIEPVRVGEGDPRFGSMQLDEDWPGGSSCSFLPAEPPRLPDADTREQMLAELSPEALERLRGPEQPQEARAPAGARCSPGNENGDRDAGFPQGPQAAVPWGDGPGPGGGSSSAPGPGDLAPLAPPEPGVGDGIEWAVNAAVKPPAGPVSGDLEQFRTPANAWERSERLAHTWDRLPVILNTETIAEWGARCREEVAAWSGEPWAVRLPWETEMIT